MKSITFIAAVSFFIQAAVNLYILLWNFEVINAHATMTTIHAVNETISVFLMVTNVGAMCFFIKLYQNQTKKVDK
jgi:hypothetical protein